MGIETSLGKPGHTLAERAGKNGADGSPPPRPEDTEDGIERPCSKPSLGRFENLPTLVVDTVLVMPCEDDEGSDVRIAAANPEKDRRAELVTDGDNSCSAWTREADTGCGSVIEPDNDGSDCTPFGELVGF